MDLTSSLKARFIKEEETLICTVPSSPNKRKNLGSFVTTQKLGKNPNFGVISEIERAKFGVLVTYIYGGKIWCSNTNFRGKFLGQAFPPPRHLNIEVPSRFKTDQLLSGNKVESKRADVFSLIHTVMLKPGSGDSPNMKVVGVLVRNFHGKP